MFKALPSSTDEQRVTMVINRVDGWIGYSYNDETKIAFRSDTIADTQAAMHIAVSFLDNMTSEIEFADKRMVWEERKGMLLVYSSQKSAFASFSGNLLRENASFL